MYVVRVIEVPRENISLKIIVLYILSISNHATSIPGEMRYRFAHTFVIIFFKVFSPTSS